MTIDCKNHTTEIRCFQYLRYLLCSKNFHHRKSLNTVCCRWNRLSYLSHTIHLLLSITSHLTLHSPHTQISSSFWFFFYWCCTMMLWRCCLYFLFLWRSFSGFLCIFKRCYLLFFLEWFLGLFSIFTSWLQCSSFPLASNSKQLSFKMLLSFSPALYLSTTGNLFNTCSISCADHTALKPLAIS